MSKPLIGITTYPPSHVLIGDQFTSPVEYTAAVRRAGGIPVLIPPGEPNLTELLARLDGLLLSGGGDIDPKHYDGSALEQVYGVDEKRDATEFHLLEQVMESGMPTFGICRGAQVINVGLGGTLIEDIETELGGNDVVQHRKLPGFFTDHGTTVQEDTKLARIMGKTQDVVGASGHHQSIRDVAPGLVVSAQAADGIIEAVEHAHHPYLVAVQWHPERTAHADPAQQKLFDAFVAAARDAMQRR